MNSPGWPVVLRDGPVELRPFRRGDARAWSELRRANESWLAPWEPTMVGNWYDLNSPLAYRSLYRELRRTARDGTAMPFAIWLIDGRTERMVGQLTIGNIVRRAFCSGHAGYWVDAAVAGRGVMPTRSGARDRSRVSLRRHAPDGSQHPAGERSVPPGRREARLPRRGSCTCVTCTSTARGGTTSVTRSPPKKSPPTADCWPGGTGCATARKAH